jgi:hypothetical protein
VPVMFMWLGPKHRPEPDVVARDLREPAIASA